MQRAPSDYDPAENGLTAATAVLEGLPLPVLVLDQRERIRFANAPIVHLFGYALVELIDKPVALLFPAELRAAEPYPFSQWLATRFKTPEESTVRMQGVRKDGKRLAFCLKYGRFDTSSEPFAVCVIQDDTGTGIQNLALTQRRLNEAQRIAKVGSWTWDFPTDTHWWSDELYRMLEVEPDTGERPYDRFLAMVHPQDRPRLAQARKRTLAGEDGDPADVRIRLASGEERVIQARGRATLDAQGRPLIAHGTLQDITEQRVTQTALKLTELRYRETQRLAKIGNWEWDLTNGKSWWSDELYQILEEDPAQYPADFDRFLQRVHPADRADLQRRQSRIAMGPNAYKDSETRLVLRSGKEKIVQHSVEVRTNEDGQPTAVVGTILDITERRALEALVRDSEARYAGTVELAAVGIAHVDPGGKLIWTNSSMHDILGYSKQELECLTVWDISHPDDVHVTDRERARMHAGELDSLRTEKRYIRKDGAVIWVKISCAARRDANGKLLYDISVVEDITPQKAAEARIQYLATHDALTGLPNRVLFTETLARSIEAARAGDRQCALIFIDLDRFKIVNDSLGHDAGDQLLKEVAQRIRRSVGPSDVTARFGGDEFVVLLGQVSDRAVAAAAAGRILSALQDPVRIMNYDCRVTASIGIAMFPGDAAEAATLMKHADMAMYLAKEEGKNNCQFYSSVSAPMSVERIVLETHLVNALQRNEFSLQYQPKIAIATGRICGVEALLRWRNPQLGRVPPSAFIPVAEDTGLIVPIGKWVLRTACGQSAAWRRAGLPALGMAVNLSPRQFKDPGLARDVTETLRESGLEAQLLELEITEGMIMNSIDQAVQAATVIKSIGVRLAIDDFGTGYSSLSQLKRFPIDTLKIDRSFIHELPDNSEDMAITESIISLGKALGVNVVAEGVETTAQETFLRNHGCDEIQGFLYGEPCDPDDFVKLFQKMSARA
ncbi:MAG TPA: EAL domain-containing protein [Steroidobacteraceae bacterium]|jgi:diguanylate cyclase (GGDEF)-like protein/PAS domain S-box-containing protein|nr:EAL domain-containing protein [Steroidobacteraceae bacterium]